MPITREEKNKRARQARFAREHTTYESLRATIIWNYTRAKPCNGGWSHDEILERMRDIWASPAYAKLSTNFKYRLLGVADCMRDYLFREVLVNTVILDGVRILNDDVPSGRFRDATDGRCGVFMPDGQFKPFQ